MFELPAGEYVRATLDGEPVAIPEIGNGGWEWNLWGLSPEHRVTITLEGAGDAPDQIQFHEFQYGGLPKDALPVRPGDAMARAWRLDGGVWLRRSIQL